MNEILETALKLLPGAAAVKIWWDIRNERRKVDRADDAVRVTAATDFQKTLLDQAARAVETHMQAYRDQISRLEERVEELQEENRTCESRNRELAERVGKLEAELEVRRADSA